MVHIHIHKSTEAQHTKDEYFSEETCNEMLKEARKYKNKNAQEAEENFTRALSFYAKGDYTRGASWQKHGETKLDSARLG